VAAALVACAASPGNTAGQATAGNGFPVTLTDANGQVTVPAAPVRVAALDESYVDAAIALETPVVAYTDYRAVAGGLPAYLGAGAAKYASSAVSIGAITKPDLEKLVTLRPDLIVSAQVRHADIHSQLAAIAPTVFSVTTGPTWKQNIRLLATALGKTALGEQKIGAYEARAKRVGDAIKAKLGRTPTISVVRFAGEPTVRVYTPNSFVGIVLADAGLAQSAASQTSNPTNIANNLSQELIPQIDADHIFVASFADPKGVAAQVQGTFEANPLWARLAGPRTTVDDETWMTAVGLQGAEKILDGLATAFGVPNQA